MTAQLALRSALARITIRDCGRVVETNRAEMQVSPVRSHYDRGRAHLLDTIHSMVQQNLVRLAAGPGDYEQAGMILVLRRSPAAAGAIQEMIGDESVLERVAGRFWKLAITG